MGASVIRICLFMAGNERRGVGGRAYSVRKMWRGGGERGICIVSSTNPLSVSLYKRLAPSFPLENGNGHVLANRLLWRGEKYSDVFVCVCVCGGGGGGGNRNSVYLMTV
jgi:hypothetical protein